MSNQLRFAICGTSRAGKDTFAAILNKRLEERGMAKATNLAFAAPLKQLYKMFFSHVETSEKPRDAYVTMGNAFREIDGDVWIYPLMSAANEAWQKGNSIIVTDTRYENEANVLAERGFIIIKVVADDFIRKERSNALGEELDLNNQGDAEVGFIKEDLLVINNGEDDFKTLPLLADLAINKALELKEATESRD